MQVPYPCNAVVPGMIKMNMARFVFWHESGEWRFVLKDNWMSAATKPDAVIHGQQLSPMVRSMHAQHAFHNAVDAHEPSHRVHAWRLPYCDKDDWLVCVCCALPQHVCLRARVIASRDAICGAILHTYVW